jgi:hypothetical protein
LIVRKRRKLSLKIVGIASYEADYHARKRPPESGGLCIDVRDLVTGEAEHLPQGFVGVLARFTAPWTISPGCVHG